MKANMRYNSVFYSLLLGIFCGCSNNKSNTESNKDNQNVSVSDSVKCIKIADSQKILPEWSKENVLIYHNIGEPDDMHPTNGNSAVRSEILLYTQVYLIASDQENLSLRPGAAKSMPQVSANGLEYTYELRNDIKWDDGKPLTAEDILFTFKANKCPLTNNPHAKPYLENLKDIVVDKNNPMIIRLIMKRQYIENVGFLTDCPIMQRTFFDPKNVLSKYTFMQFDDPAFKSDEQKDLNEWATEFNSPKYSRDPKYLVGLGAYKIEKWDAGQSITLIRKENHWTKGINTYETSYPEKIIFKINRDANSQVLEFKSQALDASTYLSTKTLLDLQKDDKFNANYNSRFTDTYNYTLLTMNTNPDGVVHKKLFVDKKVRRAMAYLVPYDDMNRIINRGKNKRMVGPVSPLKPECNNNLKLIPFDVEQAKKLLDEAGWKDTDGDNIRDKVIDGEKVQFSFNLNYLTTQIEWKDIAQMIADAMYKAGIKANLNPLDFAVQFDNAKKHNFDVLLNAWAGSSMPEDFTQLWHTSSWVSNGSNFSGFGNAESDALIDSIKYALDDTKRIALVKHLQEIIYDEQPSVFLFAGIRRVAVHKRFGNCEMTFERPGLILNNLKLLSGVSSKSSASAD